MIAALLLACASADKPTATDSAPVDDCSGIERHYEGTVNDDGLCLVDAPPSDVCGTIELVPPEWATAECQDFRYYLGHSGFFEPPFYESWRGRSLFAGECVGGGSTTQGLFETAFASIEPESKVADEAMLFDPDTGRLLYYGRSDSEPICCSGVRAGAAGWGELPPPGSCMDEYRPADFE